MEVETQRIAIRGELLIPLRGLSFCTLCFSSGVIAYMMDPSEIPELLSFDGVK